MGVLDPEGDLFQIAGPADPPVPRRKPDPLTINDVGAPKSDNAPPASRGVPMIALGAVALGALWLYRS